LFVRITVQGGICSAEEDLLLRDHFKVNGTGWGTLFLLCPEVIHVDDETLKKLINATENEVYLSDVSPLNVCFSNLRNSPSNLERDRRISIGEPGSECPKGIFVSNTEFTEKPVCLASKYYQKKKIEKFKKENPKLDYSSKEIRKILEKACICNDLGEGILINYKLKEAGTCFPAICPGSSIVNFSGKYSLSEIVDHIYGRIDLIEKKERSHFFIKELELNIEYLEKSIIEFEDAPIQSRYKQISLFVENIKKGIHYYVDFFNNAFFSKEADDELKRHTKRIKQIEKKLISNYK